MSQTASTVIETSQATFDDAPLPHGWRWVRLDEVCSFQHGGTPSKSNDDFWRGDILWVSPKDMRSVTIYDTVDHISREAIEKSSTRLVPAGTILIVVRSGILAHTLPVAIAGKPLSFNQDIKAASVITDDIDPYFLFWVLKGQSPNIIKNGVKKGATVHSVRSGFLEALRFPLPPLLEQKRIAAILNEQTAAVERARAAAEAQLKAAKVLPAAYMREVFDSSEAEHWKKGRIGDVAKVQSGYAFKSDWFTSDGIRLLRNANIFQGFISWSDTVRLSMSRRTEFEAYEMAEGDIVLSLDRPLVSSGLKVARLTTNDIPALLLQRVGRFQLRDSIDADYLFCFLNSEKFIKAITSHEHSLGVPHVSPAQVEAVELPLPPLAEQKRIAMKLTKQIQVGDQTNKTLQDQLNIINKLPAALLRQAFTGKL